MKTGSVSQAARNLNRTQPAISASLRTLEQELDMDLFLREGRRMIPVPEAQYLLGEAGDILDRLKTAEQNLVSMRNRQKGVLRIVAMPGPSAYLLPEFVSRFVADKPEVQVTLATRSSPQIRNLIAAQSFDMGLCDSTAAQDGSSAYKADFLHCACLCALPRSHPLASRSEIKAQDLDGEPMGVLQPDHSTHIDTRRAFAAAGAGFNIRIDAQYFLPLFSFVEAGQICAVVDALSATSYLDAKGARAKIVFRPFKPTVQYGYAIVTPQHNPPSRVAVEFVAQWRDWVDGAINSITRISTANKLT